MDDDGDGYGNCDMVFEYCPQSVPEGLVSNCEDCDDENNLVWKLDECNICGDLCPVQAIGSDGQINFNECYQCLKCQVAFYDDTVCPPLVQRRMRRERLEVV